ncbi:MAG: hypothetical protein EHM63_02015 [Actinobacteria bacterium]|nr:MAG: hypothetical protein EHM63_02015 [Actinomycetota bacterium]
MATRVTTTKEKSAVHYLPIIFVSDPDNYRSGNDGQLAPTSGRGIPTWVWESPSRGRRRGLRGKRKR